MASPDIRRTVSNATIFNDCADCALTFARHPFEIDHHKKGDGVIKV